MLDLGCSVETDVAVRDGRDCIIHIAGVKAVLVSGVSPFGLDIHAPDIPYVSACGISDFANARVDGVIGEGEAPAVGEGDG